MNINIKELFGWQVSNVIGPVKKHEFVGDKLEYTGYEVMVKYRNKNTGRERSETLRFMLDDERMYTLYNGPQDAATQYCAAQKRLMQRAQARMAARQK